MLQEEIGGKAPCIIKKTSRVGLLPAASTGTDDNYLAAVSANGNKDGLSKVINRGVVRPSSNGYLVICICCVWCGLQIVCFV